MTPDELSLLDEREREAWELCQKATPEPWDYDAEGDYIFAGCVMLAEMRGWGAGLSIGANGNFISAARNLLEPLLSKVVRLTRDLRAVREQQKSDFDRAELAESRISDLTDELEFFQRETMNFQINAAHRARQLADQLAGHDTVRAEAAEFERDRYKERVGVLETALREWLSNRDFVIAAGGTEGPLSQDVIRQFAKMQQRAVELSESALTPDSTRKENVSR